MNAALRNSLAVLAGIVISGVVNMAIISISGTLIPLPEGVDPNDINSINDNMHLYEPKHFLMPFLAHALGTLFGAYATARLAASRHKILSLLIGGIFLIGGIMAVSLLPNSPMWFNVTDLLLAYIPMGWLGWKLAGSKRE